MGEFFFISKLMKLFLIIYHAKKHNFPDLRGLKCEFYANFTLSGKISLNACLTSGKDRVVSILNRNVNKPAMPANYLKITARRLLRQKTISLINIFGLSVGLAACSPTCMSTTNSAVISIIPMQTALPG
jgi:hypothetical protein